MVHYCHHFAQTQTFTLIICEFRKENDVISTMLFCSCNADMGIAEIRKFCQLDEASASLMNLWARACHPLLKLPRTIADLTGSRTLQPPHLVKALQYRPKLLISG